MKVIRALSVTYNPAADCLAEDCGFATPLSPDARNQAKMHVKATGHEVRVITETVDLYRPDNT